MHRIVLVAMFLSACGSREAQANPADSAPIVGAMELPISLANQGSAPSGAARVEVSPNELRLDGTRVLALERGRVPVSEVTADVIGRLRTALASAPARSGASLRVHSMVPYQTLARVLHTLEVAGLRDVTFAVRRDGASPTEAWMHMPHVRVVPTTGDVAFTSQPLPWSTFVDHWQAVYDACRAGQYIDCDSQAMNPAVGGSLQIVLWTRGQGMKVIFQQAGAPDPAEAEAAAGGGGGGVALIEGVRAVPRAQPEVVQGPPAVEGSFTVRMQESTHSPSALSNLVRPICGQQSCQTIFETDATAPTMRVLSMIGAVFPDGTPEPELVLRLPRN